MRNSEPLCRRALIPESQLTPFQELSASAEGLCGLLPLRDGKDGQGLGVAAEHRQPQ